MQVPDEWDVLWSPSTTAQRALTEPPQPLAAHHCVNAIPGSRALTRKKLLSSTLRAVGMGCAHAHISGQAHC